MKLWSLEVRRSRVWGGTLQDESGTGSQGSVIGDLGCDIVCVWLDLCDKAGWTSV